MEREGGAGREEMKEREKGEKEKKGGGERKAGGRKERRRERGGEGNGEEREVSLQPSSDSTKSFRAARRIRGCRSRVPAAAAWGR